jgi:hypothetical protein
MRFCLRPAILSPIAPTHSREVHVPAPTIIYRDDHGFPIEQLVSLPCECGGQVRPTVVDAYDAIVDLGLALVEVTPGL